MAQHQQQPPQAFVTIPPMTTAYQSAPVQTRPRYKQAAGRATGHIQIICGLASIAFGVCVLLALFGVIHDPALHLGHVVFGIVCWPIWSGIVFLIAGSLGAATKPGSNCLIVGYMVMSIIAAIFAAGQLIWESIAASVTKCYEYDYYYYGSYECEKPMVSYGMHLGAVVAAILEIIAAITGSAFCCHGYCCSGQPQNTQMVVQHVQYAANPQTTLVTDASTVNPGPYLPSAPGPYIQAPGSFTPAPGQYPPAYSASPEYNPTAPDQTYMEMEGK